MNVNAEQELTAFLTAAAEGREWDGPAAPAEPEPKTVTAATEPQACECGRSDLAHMLGDGIGATLFALAVVAAQETGESFDQFRTAFETGSGMSSTDEDWQAVRAAWECGEGNCDMGHHGHE
jgi:hypothetical protein